MCFLGDLKITVLGEEIWELSVLIPQHPRDAPQKPDRSPPDQSPPASARLHTALLGTKTMHLLPSEAMALFHPHRSCGPGACLCGSVLHDGDFGKMVLTFCAGS